MQRTLANSLALVVCSSMLMASHVFANYENPITYKGVTTVPCLLLALVDLLFLICVPIIVVFLIYGGFLFVTAGDNESQIGKAKTCFLWCLIGGVVLLGAKAISLAIQDTVLSIGAAGAAGPAC